ncbi:hypothetical protein CJF32_00001967 [Rutstroemia sp. NJR-2017a WRK4]|nr:hypothetical protein CJF32_00001967 [Rutstroemia sp. NJR-2017a WRK4]
MAIPESNGKTLLITGINGYIASVLADHLLKKGYSIRGTTRRIASTEPLLRGPWAPYQERIKIYEVPDMTINGAFDESSKGKFNPTRVHGIFHTASPIDFTLTTYEATVIPAIQGSLTLLTSALHAGPQLTSVVLTSSCSAINDIPPTPTHTFTEADFAYTALSRAESDLLTHTPTPPRTLYSASKTASERAVWKFREEKHPPFAITTINPTTVIGPPLLLPPSPEKLNETLRPLYALLSGELTTLPPTIGSGSFVDVRDVADMHVWAYEHAARADGERYIACCGFGPPQAQADILRMYFVDRKPEMLERIPRGETGVGYEGWDGEKGGLKAKVEYTRDRYRFSGGKAEREMGVRYRGLEESCIDTAETLGEWL